MPGQFPNIHNPPTTPCPEHQFPGCETCEYCLGPAGTAHWVVGSPNSWNRTQFGFSPAGPWGALTRTEVEAFADELTANRPAAELTPGQHSILRSLIQAPPAPHMPSTPTCGHGNPGFCDRCDEDNGGLAWRRDADPVDHPAHYTAHPSGVECITVTEHMGFNLGNAVKYLWRADLKGDAIEDLRKAAWYVQREIARRGGES